MKKKNSPAKWVRYSAESLPKRSAKDLARLDSACSGPVDTSDIRQMTAADFRKARKSSRRMPQSDVTMPLDDDLARVVKRIGPAKVNRILRQYLMTRPKAKAG